MIDGLLLAAGAGRRMGRPKALVPGWLRSSADALRAGGCDRVTVVLGAAADEAVRLIEGELPGVSWVVARDWAEGMGASLRTGLAVADTADTDDTDGATAVLIHLVDLPDVGPEVIRRVISTGAPAGAAALARATYGGVPGHPVLLGRDHWAGVIATATGDQGARAYLRAHDVLAVECGDLAGGRDVDRPPAAGAADRTADRTADQP
jgi:CTP:molybdopterin cytidylyltransferase MocA